MNQLTLAVIAGVVVSAGAFTAGWRVNGWRIEAAQHKADQVEQRATKAATDAAVEVIKGLQPKFTTINREVEREIVEKPVYRDCQHSPDTWRLLERAYQAAGGEPFGPGAGLPAADAAAGSELRGNDQGPD